MATLIMAGALLLDLRGQLLPLTTTTTTTTTTGYHYHYYYYYYYYHYYYYYCAHLKGRAEAALLIEADDGGVDQLRAEDAAERGVVQRHEVGTHDRHIGAPGDGSQRRAALVQDTDALDLVHPRVGAGRARLVGGRVEGGSHDEQEAQRRRGARVVHAVEAHLGRVGVRVGVRVWVRVGVRGWG